MPLSAGTRLGPYEIVAPLGAGGMGEVYRARDTRLGRVVALKVLPASLHHDPALQARFEREAQTLAALNHPRIAAIHDVVDVGDRRAIVMEFVPGRTLAEIIAGGPVPLRAAIGYAIDISEALSVAHAAGIVHRDLKPANVVVTDEGFAKVLDFGIAKLAGPGDADAMERATKSMLTEDRAMVGTIGYMSPEQAHGHPVDARSDIFSLGVVLHEMISGRHAFEGDTTAARLASVLRDDPPLLGTLVPGTSRTVERLVARCLQKDPRRRYQAAFDLKVVLEDARDDLALPVWPRVDGSGLPAVSPVPLTRRVLRATAFGAVAAAIAVPSFIAASAVRSPVVLTPRYRPFITEVAPGTTPAWSPDGRTLAYLATVNGETEIFVRGIAAAQSTQVTRLSGPVLGELFWSPDGSRIYFVNRGELTSVSAAGGEPQLVSTAAPGSEGRPAVPSGQVRAACISPDGRTIVFARGNVGDLRLWTLDTGTRESRPMSPAGMPLSLVNVQALAFSRDGATIAALASTTAANSAPGVWLIAWPAASARHALADVPYLAASSSIGWMPDSRRVVLSGYPLHGGTNRLLMGDTSTGAIIPLTEGRDSDGGPSIAPDGSRIAFVSQKSGMDLIQFPIDGGPPQPLVATSRSESRPDMSASGVLAYLTDAEGYPAIRIRSGTDTWPRAIGGASELERDRATQPGEVRLSPDGQRVAIATYAAAHLLWIYPTAGGTPVRLDAESTDQHGASWSPDGNWIAYRRLLKGTWSIVKAPLGGGPVVRLDDATPGGGQTDWSSNGLWIAHARPDGMHLVSPDGTSTRVFAGLRTGSFRFSRDGARLFAATRGADRQWQLAIWDVAAGRELRVVPLPLASSANLDGLALSPDESRIIVGAGTDTSDIWLLEEFEPTAPSWARWLRR